MSTALLFALAFRTALAVPAGPTGHWEGTIRIPDHELAIVLDLDRAPSGPWIGSVTIPGSTSVNVPLSGLSVEGMAIHFHAALPGETEFEGRVASDGESVNGTASNERGSAPFVATRRGDAHVEVPPPSTPIAVDLEGRWTGVITAGDRQLHLAIQLGRDAHGTGVATLIAVDQGNLEIPISTVVQQGTAVRLETRAVSGTFTGTLAGAELSGTWTQGGRSLPLVLHRSSTR